MGNYSSKLFSNNISNDVKVNQRNHVPQEPHVTSEQMPQNSEKPDIDGIIQTPIKRNPMLETRKRTNAIPEYLQTEKTRKPYLETDLDSVATEKLWLDPRSPNVAYPRTPILLQNNLGSAAKNVNRKSLSEINLPHAELRTSEINLDPRSPASDFDRTPISTVRISKQFNSQGQDNTNGLKKSNSSLDICIKLSYCETTSLFNIPEIQALPDIVVSLRRSCSLKDNLNENNSASTTSDVNVKSELMPDDLSSVKHHVSSENSMPDLQEETESAKQTETKNEVTEMDGKQLDSTNAVSESNIDPPENLENVNKATDPEEKFKVWRDSYSKLPEHLLSPENEEILIEFDDCSITNNVRNNQVRKIEKTEGSLREKKGKSVDKKCIESKKERKLLEDKKLFSPEMKMTSDISKNRTPFSNRSNSNGRIQASSVKSPQQFLGHRKLFITEKNKNLQENTPPAHKIRAKNVPAKLNGTQWDSDSTIII